MKTMYPMTLQLHADPASGGEPQTPPAQQTPPAGAQTPPAQQTPPAGAPPAAQQQGATIDYAKIQQMLDGTLAAKEDTALKAYFKQQGLSQQEVEQAIADFKKQKAANTPDAAALQVQAAQAQAEAQKAQVESAATIAAVGLGIDAKTIPYVLKMADLTAVVGADGKINEETLTNALKKVLEDVPGLKPQANGSNGFMQVGASGGTGTQGTATEDALKKAFGL